ncbi:abscisic acid 8'-hydroxylase 2 isoform X2 [Beta vulgaris subsp. vulgaris]|uniref:abscisic acid 8'-hydroxylase 2 isoform X2 n=1 Tax=Beta vulgaris subsp. vulgaris TaxID=3555 RepID=UPI00203677CC|nr:abscisic acid 8'-hydroxylase 2 isoform X2 [Beta vulgaris subsp. vulgaris]
MALRYFLFVPLSLVIGYLMKKLWLISHNYNNYGKSQINIPPGSRGLFPYIGETLQFIAAIYSKQGFYSFVQARHLRYGNCFKTHIFGETHVFVSSTKAAKEIMSNDLGKFTKKYIRSIGEVVGSESLLCASHQSHKLLRRHLLDLFTSKSITDFTKQFDELVIHTLLTWEYKGHVVILDEALKARKRIMDMLGKIIQERRIKHSAQVPVVHHHQDFLQYLLLALDRESCSSDQEPTLTDAHIKDNILTMIIAGQDTTASAMTWMVKYLDENQGVLEVLLDEVHNQQKIAAHKSFLTLEELNEMTYGAKVVKECLRMASIVPWFPRVALHDCNILGYTIEKGWNINVDARSIHFDPTLHKDPHQFNPSRFDIEPKAYSYLAFGAGGRTCLGMNLARTMMLVFLYRLLTTYKWEVTDRDSSLENWALFSRLKSGCPIQVTRLHK